MTESDKAALILTIVFCAIALVVYFADAIDKL